ncbi:hypothetical protein AK830_g294 [Neonectria ditissima]|uniref:Yippee domain-containing protein n=2 Tax=Neonectria TaxID=140106 RepID=A0A0P7BLP6_9HYPO|nr:hypothetical protein AK830_g294 [Neonectria ditissima]
MTTYPGLHPHSRSTNSRSVLIASSRASRLLLSTSPPTSPVADTLFVLETPTTCTAPLVTTPRPDRSPGIMGLAYNTYLNSSKIYGCKTCKAHLANHEDIISRNFRGQHGKAYLFHSVVNIDTGAPNERNMTTGRHVVRDIACRQCKETVGWKYDKAYEPSEKYKEGKFILEAELLCNVT